MTSACYSQTNMMHTQVLLHKITLLTVGVRVHRSSGDIDIHAPLIISNTGLFNTVALMPPEIREKSSLNRMVTEKKVKSSLACLQVFVGLKGSPEELKLKAQNVWAYSS